MPLVRRVISLCLAVGVLVAGVLAAPAGADSAQHRLHQAKARAAHLDALARAQATRIAAARTQLAALDAQANDALAGWQSAQLSSAKAATTELSAQAELDVAVQAEQAAQQRLNDLAAGAYVSQDAGGSFGATLSLIRTGDPTSMLDGLNLLDQVGKSNGRALAEMQLARGQQQHAELAAAQAADAAAQAAQAALTAKQHADALVGAQQKAVAELNALLARTKAAASRAHRTATALERAIAAARARAAAIRRAQALAARAMPVPGCDGASLAGYSNGALPTGALCGLWGAPGEMLRADAAGAFNRMSRAFSAAFREPLCVTASYRTYERQVELYATMPAGFAAVPGTSNHGWAVAVDLCGGIQVDSSPEHLWLLDHAASYGWFHPAWAMPGAAGPHEPWHWEYAG